MRGRGIMVGLGALVVAGCSGNNGNFCPPGPDLCVSYCGHLLSAACGWPSNFGSACVNECRAATSSMVPAECMDVWNATLACGSCATINCPQQMCINQGTQVCIDQSGSVTGCDQEKAAWLACGGDCLQQPITFGQGGSFDGGTVTIEITTSRCACPATLEPGGAVGAPCRASQECAQVCCACATGPGRYLGRACVNGRCVGDPDACSLDPSIVGFCGGRSSPTRDAGPPMTGG